MRTAALHHREYKRFCKRLRQAREESGLTQVEVAKALKKPQSWVSKSESGERRVDVIELSQLAKLYSRDVGWFVP